MSVSRRVGVLLLVALPRVGAAQAVLLDVPLKSQRAAVSQTIGLTDITITYHRPLANGRVIWDSLVPYGQVWRAGANVNTTIAFSDPVTIDGQPLAKGTYGLHMIPAADRWTIIFSNNATSWGSFTYHQDEDALRVTVVPRAGPMRDALTFEFDSLEPASTVVEMSWDKVVVPFRVAVDVHAVAQASIRRQLRTLARYTWMSWDEGASYLLGEGIALDTALEYTSRSIALEDRFDNELTKSKVLRALDRPTEASVAERRAVDLGTAAQLDQFARDLLAAKHTDGADAIFLANAKKHPDQWVAHEGLARMYSAQKKFGDAAKQLRTALALAPESARGDLGALMAKLRAGQDIN
jgi:hypothetical protein